MTKLINCTPHDIIIVTDEIYGDYISSDDTEIIPAFFIIEKSGIIPRLKEVQEKIDVVKTTATRKSELEKCGYDNGWNITVDIMQKSFSEIEGLPEPKKDTYYIVSALVAGAAKDRKDLLIPNELVRDEKGRIIGCKNLARI